MVKGDLVPLNEEEIFEVIGMKYLKPEQRIMPYNQKVLYKLFVIFFSMPPTYLIINHHHFFILGIS